VTRADVLAHFTDRETAERLAATEKATRTTDARNAARRSEKREKGQNDAEPGSCARKQAPAHVGGRS
jgi:hypothetical protein